MVLEMGRFVDPGSIAITPRFATFRCGRSEFGVWLVSAWPKVTL